MHETPEILDAEALSEITEQTDLAIALVDGNSHEIAVWNNNSICKTLNPGAEFSKACSMYCGAVHGKVHETGRTVKFECHAGLECTAVAREGTGSDLVFIIGRTFVNPDNYKKAVERTMSGDWAKYDTSDFFANILMTSSAASLETARKQIEARVAERKDLFVNPETKPIGKMVARSEGTQETEPHPKTKKAAEEISRMVERFNRELGLKPKLENSFPPATENKIAESIPESPAADPIQHTTAELTEKRLSDVSSWRSFFGSLLKNDYKQATVSILEFLASHYGWSSLIWLDKNANRLENTTAFGDLQSRKLRLGIASDDVRLIDALHDETPLVLGERTKSLTSKGMRKMSLFPIGVGETVSAAIAVLDPIDEDRISKQLFRICRSLAPQLEILRLRSEVERGKTLANAVRRFSEGIKHAEGDDLWLTLTQNAAELLRAERASLLLYNEKTKSLDIKAIVGVVRESIPDREIGGRVAQMVFNKNKTAMIADVSKTGLPPAPVDRKYKTQSFLSCPISIGSRTIGVMNFADKGSGQAFDRNSSELFEAIAPQLAVAIDRATFKERAGTFEQLSVTDSLTGLLNRRYIEERLMEETKRSNRHGYPMSFLMLDIDQFKSFNDEFGHPAGDKALKLFGHVIRETLRGADVAARFGGEEFAILLPQTTPDEAWTIAERIRANVEGTDFVHRQVTTSIGIASCSAKLCISADLVSAADKALYEAKRSGRNRVVAFEQLNNSQAAAQNGR